VVLPNLQIPLLLFELQGYMIFICVNIQILNYLFLWLRFQSSFMDYFDSFTLLFVLLPCAWILFYTKSFKAFGRALLFAVGRTGGALDPTII